MVPLHGSGVSLGDPTARGTVRLPRAAYREEQELTD